MRKFPEGLGFMSSADHESEPKEKKLAELRAHLSDLEERYDLENRPILLSNEEVHVLRTNLLDDIKFTKETIAKLEAEE